LGKELVQQTELDASVVGNEACRCIGVANSSGSVVATYPQGNMSIGVVYPSDVGSHCNTWDLHSGPDCVATGGPQPDFCSQKWCYVDPCSCGLDSPPTTSLMLSGATYHGKTLYYSYATCGGEDSFTSSSHATACVNQESESNCSALSKCAWTGEKCLGKELATACAEEQPAPLSSVSSGCPCIAIGGDLGNLNVTIGSSTSLYPSDLGGSCETWDEGLHPDCKGWLSPRLVHTSLVLCRPNRLRWTLGATQDVNIPTTGNLPWYDLVLLLCYLRWLGLFHGQ